MWPFRRKRLNKSKRKSLNRVVDISTLVCNDIENRERGRKERESERERGRERGGERARERDIDEAEREKRGS